MDELLRMEHVSKRFGDFYANRDINLSVRKGEVHTLLGENGAGKSTLMNVLIGLYQPTEGKIFLNGKEVRIDSPAQAVKLGIGMVHQHFMLVEAMTVFENIILGDRNTKGIFIDKEARKKEILELAERYGLDVELDRPSRRLPWAPSSGWKILKTLYRGAELLILDEPINGLDPIGIAEVRDFIRELCDAGGKTILISSHILSEISLLADDVGIIGHGRLLEEESLKELEAKNAKYIHFCVSDAQKAAQVIAAAFRSKDIQLADANNLYLYDTALPVARINRSFIEAGIDIQEAHLCENTLEDYFKEITGGEGIA